MNRRTPFIVAGAAVTVFGLIYADLLTGGKTFTHDAIVFFGIVQYFFDNLSRGVFPLWDPYLTTGTFFYPNIPIQGLLDPSVFVAFAMVKIFGLAPLAGYSCLMFLRLFVTVIGAFYLYNHLAKDKTSAVIAAGVLLFALPHSYFHQFGVVGHLYLTPFALFFLIRFFEEPSGPKQLCFLSCLTLVMGISMNIYIPAHFLFNFIVVLVLLIILKAIHFRDLIISLREKRNAIFTGVLVFLLLLMLSVPLLVYYFDASSDGELFPMQRIIQKNDRVFKKIMASETSTSNLSSKFTHEQAVFNSIGNVVNLLYPDILTSFKYWTRGDVDQLSEIYLYIGIIPFIIALVGMLYHKSRCRPVLLITMVLTFLCGFSLSAVHDQPYNLVQQILNFLFPPLKMIQGRQNFGYFTLLYLCAFFGLGLSLILKNDGFLPQNRRRITALSLAVIAAKIIVTGYYGERAFIISGTDAVIILEILLFALFVHLRGTQRIGLNTFAAVLLATIFLDLALYNISSRNEILQDGRPFQEALASLPQDPEKPGDFQFFREPLVILPFPHLVGFEESIAREKGALSYGFNHSFFTTRRYYDFLTHVPLQNQFALDGVVYPILRFYPKDAVVPVSDKKTVLDAYRTGDVRGIADKLYIEEKGTPPKDLKEMKDFSQYDDAPWLQPNPIMDFSESFYTANRSLIDTVRQQTDQYLHSPQASLKVLEFSANELTLQVSNFVNGYLQYNDGWSRYWEAFDNGRKIPINIANYNSKAIYLPAGTHQIRFVFNPVHYKIGLAAYCAGLLLCSGMILGFGRKI